jgi:hypothetical protein
MKDYLKRHIWILTQLYQHPEGVTYKEFKERWENCSLNTRGTGLPKRTFADCIKAIEEAFDIDISNDARNGYRYKIVQRDWIQKDRIKDWLLSSFAVNTILNDSRGLKERVVYEEIPSGNRHLLQTLEAMRDNRVLRIIYQDYFDEEPREVLLEPYLVRVFKKRWYVVGPMENEPSKNEPMELTNQGRIRRYALDRVEQMEITGQNFHMPRQFSAEDYFYDAFGIIVEREEYNVETIRLKAYNTNHRRDYLRSLPLHWSQQEIEEQHDYSVFELRLMPTYDFIQELLSMGDEVEVLAPDCVRQEMKRRIKNMGELYD